MKRLIVFGKPTSPEGKNSTTTIVKKPLRDDLQLAPAADRFAKELDKEGPYDRTPDRHGSADDDVD